MQRVPLSKAGWMALLITLAFVTGWEAYWRSQGFALSYNDDEPLWAYHRQRIYQTTPSAPTLIGSSRIKFGMDLNAWQETTGGMPTQLALVGTSPRPILADLAKDEKFTGTVLVDVVEPLFFTPSNSPFDKRAQNCLAFYPNWSLSQKASFHVNEALESKLLFLDEERFALRFLLQRLPLENRPDVFAIPPFPLEFTVNDANRQTLVTETFAADTTLQNKQKEIWWNLFTKAPKMPMADSTMNAIFDELKADVQKIQARGGKVLFVRMPSSGPLWEIERKGFPREKFWDRLLRHTGAQGIHFADYPQLAKFECIEWSHLSAADAKAFTKKFIPLMQQKTGWNVNLLLPTAASSSNALTTR